MKTRIHAVLTEGAVVSAIAGAGCTTTSSRIVSAPQRLDPPLTFHLAPCVAGLA